MGEPATPASDLYSLGMLAYECLAATPPFRGTPLEVALAHRDRPLPTLPPSTSVGVAALVMRLAAKDPARRPNDAAEIAVWAALLRDGVGVSALQMWPEQPPAAGLFQRRTILAYACVAVTVVVVIVLASVIGFASTPGPVAAAPASAPAPPSASSSHNDVTTPPAGRHPASPVTSPRQQPAASPVAKRKPAGAVPAAVMAAAPAPGSGPDHGKARGKTLSHGDGTENGPGNGNGQSNGKSEGD
jgi:serine/threonine-protein kinase